LLVLKKYENQWPGELQISRLFLRSVVLTTTYAPGTAVNDVPYWLNYIEIIQTNDYDKIQVGYGRQAWNETIKKKEIESA
jgi:hypothetical protein